MDPSPESEQLVSNDDNDNYDKEIKQSYKQRDADSSKKYHDKKSKNDNYDAVNKHNDDSDNDDNHYGQNTEQSGEHKSAEDKHKGEAGEFIKSIIFGGLDGVITLFAIVASISGSNLSAEVILVLGFAKLVGDGISMGVGDFLSEQAEIDFTKSEYERENWEFENYKDGEVTEMVELYQEKGVSKQDAETILNTLAKYPKFFVDHMMVQELELDPSCMEDNPLKNGGITLASFLVFGTIPLLSYLVFAGIDTGDGTDWKFIIAIVLTCLTLFGMGAVKGYYTNLNPIKQGLFVMGNGVIAAGSAYLIGYGLSEGLDIHGLDE